MITQVSNLGQEVGNFTQQMPINCDEYLLAQKAISQFNQMGNGRLRDSLVARTLKGAVLAHQGAVTILDKNGCYIERHQAIVKGSTGQYDIYFESVEDLERADRTARKMSLTCSCKDYQHNAPYWKGDKVCKHILAFRIARRVSTERKNAIIIHEVMEAARAVAVGRKRWSSYREARRKQEIMAMSGGN